MLMAFNRDWILFLDIYQITSLFLILQKSRCKQSRKLQYFSEVYETILLTPCLIARVVEDLILMLLKTNF